MSWDGLLLVNKPHGMTSHTVVQMVRERLEAAKAGHLGTLDPLATGVLPVCLGKATRLAPFYMGADKCYIASIRFGYFTTTDDREGRQDGPFYKIRFSEEQLQTAVASLQGELEQIPPAYSARKVKGERAYKLARKGVKPDLPAKKVNIHEIQLIQFEKQFATIFIHCSSGTYVRSMARELGNRLRCGAHIHELTRTRFNHFTIDQTCVPDGPMEELKTRFIPMEQMLSHIPELVVDLDHGKKILTGNAIQVSQSFQQEWVRVFDEEKTLLAFAQVQAQGDTHRILPKIVFSE